MQHLYGLDELITALRESGLRVGIGEVLRLQAVVAKWGQNAAPNEAAPSVAEIEAAATTRHDHLRGVVRAIIVKSVEQGHVFDRAYKRWCMAADASVRTTSPEHDPDAIRVAATPRYAPAPSNLRVAVQTTTALAIVAAALTAPTAWLWRSQPDVEQPLASEAATGATTTADTGTTNGSPPPTPEEQATTKAKPDPVEPATPVPATKPAEPSPAKQSDVDPPPAPGTPLPADADPLEPVPGAESATFVSLVPTFTVQDPTPPWWPWLLLGLASLATGALWQRLRDRQRVHLPAKVASGKGPPRVRLAPQPSDKKLCRLLSMDDEDALVWGIGKFVADESTQHLDLDATVRASAQSGGLPRLHFEAARHQREVWLWVDHSVDDPTLRHAAHDVATTLRSGGLAVEVATFHGRPDELYTERNEAFTPADVEDRRATATVAILTDGRLLEQWQSIPMQARATASLLRTLSNWPRLGLVDFGPERRMTNLVEGYDLRCVPPHGLATFLGGESLRTKSQSATYDRDLCVWRAVVSLAESAVPEASAFALRQALQLRCSRWSIGLLHAASYGPSGQLQFKYQQRAEWLGWLATCQDQTSEEPTWLRQAAAWWSETYQRHIEAATLPADEPPTPAVVRLRIEQALIRLWDRSCIPDAVDCLWTFYGSGEYGGEIERAMQQRIAADDRPVSGALRLPWRWAEIEALDAHKLLEMGMSPGLKRDTEVARPGRLYWGFGIALGLCGGTTLGAAATLVRQVDTPPIVQVVGNVPHSASTPRIERLDEPVDDSAPPYHVTVASNWWTQGEIVNTGAELTLHWREESRPCVESLDTHTQVWRCTGHAQKEATSSESFDVAIAAEPDASNRALAHALLDVGFASWVLIGDSVAARQRLQARRNAHTGPMLIFGGSVEVDTRPDTLSRGTEITADWRVRLNEHQDTSSDERKTAYWAAVGKPTTGTWTKALQFDGTQTLAETWAAFGGVTGPAAETSIAGTGRTRPARTPCKPGEDVWTDRRSGLVFVRICGGSFEMGSDHSTAEDDERPVHTVTLDEFWMALTETTVAQYKHGPADVHEDVKNDGPQLPITSVSWPEARRYCEHFGHTLPTEAQWEYAARAGTSTQWSFGDDETKLGEYAWYSQGLGRNAHEVRQKKPNPWGLFDMHGNVYEWVWDVYGTYRGTTPPNPRGPDAQSADDLRVVRGGAFIDSPRFLRSSSRFRVWPSFQFRDFGFRCIRGSGRQP